MCRIEYYLLHSKEKETLVIQCQKYGAKVWHALSVRATSEAEAEGALDQTDKHGRHCMDLHI